MKTKTRKQMLTEELASLCGMVRGSLVHTLKKCGRPGCECAQGRLHPFCYLSRSGKGARNHIVYVKPSEADAFGKAVAMYNRAWELIEELSELNIKEIKGNGIDARGNRGSGGKETPGAEGGNRGRAAEVQPPAKRKDLQGRREHPRPAGGRGAGRNRWRGASGDGAGNEPGRAL